MGDLTVSLVQFDTEYEQLQDFRNIHDVPLLTDSIYIPRGMTALNDSWVRLINETGERLAAMAEASRPEKVLCISLTDGLENASRIYPPYKGGNEFIKKLVEQQEREYSWQFLYIGSNQDSQAEGFARGVHNYMNFSDNMASVAATYTTLSTETRRYRTAKAGSKFDLKKDKV